MTSPVDLTPLRIEQAPYTDLRNIWDQRTKFSRKKWDKLLTRFNEGEPIYPNDERLRKGINHFRSLCEFHEKIST